MSTCDLFFSGIARTSSKNFIPFLGIFQILWYFYHQKGIRGINQCLSASLAPDCSDTTFDGKIFKPRTFSHLSVILISSYNKWKDQGLFFWFSSSFPCFHFLLSLYYYLQRRDGRRKLAGGKAGKGFSGSFTANWRQRTKSIERWLSFYIFVSLVTSWASWGW